VLPATDESIMNGDPTIVQITHAFELRKALLAIEPAKQRVGGVGALANLEIDHSRDLKDTNRCLKIRPEEGNRALRTCFF
jgi:hypothetical protein